jgi:hypothetical protein
MTSRLFPHALVLASACLAGCVFDDDAPARASATGVQLAPVGSEAALAAFINNGRAAAGSGALPTQRMVGAPATFGGVMVQADGGFAAGGGGAPGGGGAGAEAMASPGSGVMAGADNAPSDDGLNNVQVNGVEEPDRVKSDGNYLYVAEQPDAWLYPLPVALPPVAGPVLRRGVPRDGISIGIGGGGGSVDIDIGEVLPPPVPATAYVSRFRLDADTPGATALSGLELTGLTGNISQLNLLLSGGDTPRLVAMGQSNNWGWERWFAPVDYNATQETRLWVFDTTDPENIGAPLASLTLKGELVDSRRVDSHLYLVTRYSPTPGSDPIVPQLAIGSATHPLVPPADCLVPAGDDGYPSLTFIVAVDLAAPANSKAACFAGEVYTMYMSRESLYLAAQKNNPEFDWTVGTRPLPMPLPGDVTAGGAVAAASTAPAASAVAPVNTVIHRFALNDGEPEYRGSGMVAGGFTGWMGTGSEPQWRFNERNGLLYVMTSWWDADDLHHHLYVLAPDDDDNLVTAAQLPNAAHPAPIGKPREDIYAMRYVGDRAYVVTFRRTDPLYVIDLADPLAPLVAGELELPGFSAYLHPVGADWLLGIGRGASGGVEANIFDVRNPAAPLVHRNLPICSACETPLLTDYHAIAVQRRDGAATRVALPLQSWALANELAWRPQELAALLEVEPVSGEIALAGTLTGNTGYTALGRVLLIADAVFIPQLGGVSYGKWPVPLAL